VSGEVRESVNWLDSNAAVGAEMAESRCPFCKKSAAEERDRVGQTFRKDGVMVHQYCLYFAAGLHQRGEESEGVQGFLLSDIRKEVIRASKLTCKYCHQKGAATGCVVKSCRQTCHVPCGMENGFFLQHQGRFEAFCPAHRPKQKTLLVEAALLKSQKCPACLLEIDKNRRDQFKMLVCPVCETGFHRSCVQQQAWLAGLDFCSCSMCSNRELFLREMLEMGVEIPE
ncbi:G2/M phase-specific E3 ubiquitin-protein ligase, partial [Geodia barretti]